MKRALFLGLGAVGAALSALVACAAEDSSAQPDADPVTAVPSTDAGGVSDASSPDAADGDVADAWSPCGGFGLCLLDAELPTLVALNAVTGTAADDVWIVGSLGTVLHGGGDSFARVASGSDETLFSAWTPARGDVWIAAATAPLHGTLAEDGGTSFERVTGSTWSSSSNTGGRIWAVFGSSPDDVWLAGESTSRFGGYASVFKLDANDGGVPAWRAQSICPPRVSCYPSVRAAWGTPEGPVWLVGARGENYTLESADGGSVWAIKDSRSAVGFDAVWSASNGQAWAVGAGGTIRRYSTALGVWEVMDAPVTSALHGVWGNGPDDVWIVGDDGVVLHWDGTAFHVARMHDRTEVAPDLNAVWGLGEELWIVGNGVIFHAGHVGSP